MEPSNEFLSQLANLPASPYRFPQGHRVWGRPETARLQVSLNPAAYQEIMSHAASQGAEVGGILLGFVFRAQAGDAYHVSIEKVLADATRTDASPVPASVGNTPGQAVETYQMNDAGYSAMLAERDRRFPQYTVVGWYHTRENAAVLPVDSGLSPRQRLFLQPWQVELVVDPTRNEGYFYWVDEQGNPALLPGYYERIHPGFGWTNWGKPASGRGPAAVAGEIQAGKRSYRLPLLAAILALVFLCSLAFAILNWQKAVADRQRAAIELQDTRYQLDMAIQRILTLQPALYVLNPASQAATPAVSGTATTPLPGTSPTQGAVQASPTFAPTNTISAGTTQATATPTPEATPTEEPVNQTQEPQPTVPYP